MKLYRILNSQGYPATFDEVRNPQALCTTKKECKEYIKELNYVNLYTEKFTVEYLGNFSAKKK